MKAEYWVIVSIGIFFALISPIYWLVSGDPTLGDEQYLTGCGAGLSVHWCVYEDGHDWPEFGPEGIWEFFRGL